MNAYNGTEQMLMCIGLAKFVPNEIFEQLSKPEKLFHRAEFRFNYLGFPL